MTELIPQPGRIIVAFDETLSHDEAEAILIEYGLEAAQWLQAVPTAVVIVPEGNEQEWIVRFISDKRVEYAQFHSLRRVPRPGNP